MSGLLLDQTFPGASTCIVIGALDDVTPAPDLSRYRVVLWFTDAVASLRPPASVARDCLQLAPVEKISPGEITPTLERFVRLNPRTLPSLLITADVARAHTEIYQRIIDAVHAHLESTQRARVTRQKDGFTWQKHLLQNIPAYARHRLPATWAGALRGTPAFVVGAGPSLDLSIAALAAHAGRAVIFSADSALRALARHGVAADFAVSTDAAKIPEKCLPEPAPIQSNPIGYSPPSSPSAAAVQSNPMGYFLPSGLMPGRVVLASVSPPAWQQALPAERTFFLSANQITDDWLATLSVPRTPIAVAESCGSTALELAVFLGCEPIYLFGLDLAVDPANQAQRHQQHADPALYAKSNYDPTIQLPRVPGNYAETVPSFALGDWRDLDARLAARTAPKIFNVNDRGARLRGTTLVHPDAFTLDAPALDKPTALAALPPAVPPTRGTAFDRVRDVGQRCAQVLPGLQRAFERGGPIALADAFRPVILDAETGRALGAFALKLMPHLVPPIDPDRALWQTLLTEFTELTTLAREIR